jgi:hypothetical protein
MRWPARRFPNFFHRFLVRRACDELKDERDRMLLAIECNPVWWEGDPDKMADGRRRRADAVHRSYKAGVEYLWGTIDGKRERSEEPDPMESDPLFRPLRDQAYQMADGIGPPVPEQAGMGAALIS